MNEDIDLNKLTYRKGVIGIITNKEDKFLIIQSLEYSENEWRFAGGGLDENETSEEALLRELHEELGSNNFRIIKKSNYQIKYDWPMSVIKSRLAKKGVTYRGQIQDQYLVMFTGDDSEIVLQPNELRKFKWVKYDELKDHFIFPNQWEKSLISLKELVPQLINN